MPPGNFLLSISLHKKKNEKKKREISFRYRRYDTIKQAVLKLHTKDFL